MDELTLITGTQDEVQDALLAMSRCLEDTQQGFNADRQYARDRDEPCRSHHYDTWEATSDQEEN